MSGRTGFLVNGRRVLISTEMSEKINIARSPSRALRRWRTGKRKVTPWGFRPMKKAVQMPDGTLIMHPATYDALCKRLAQTPDA